MSQLGPLLALRWRMVRSSRARAGLGLLLAAATGLLVAAVVAGLLLPEQHRTEALLLTPTVLAAFLVVALLAPLAAGGGNELYPAEQLVALPVSARTQFLAGLLLLPLNLAWFTQLFLLLGLVAFGVDDATPRGVLALVTLLAYVGFATVFGQAAGWAVVGLRRSRRGRLAVWAGTAVLTTALVVLVGTVGFTRLLDQLPTRTVLTAALNGSSGSLVTWSWQTVLLVAAAAGAWRVGVSASAWALHRPGDRGAAGEDRPLPRRGPRATTFAALVATDRASVWRARSLRRGTAVLALMPGAVALVAGLDWSSLVLLPGLVAAGSGLLFGVNAFCLDGGGATFLAALPFDPRLAYWAKARVVAESCALPVAVALVAGAARAPGAPDLTTLACVVGSALSGTALVVASCLSWSVARPHRADLRGARDTPAPPGTMTVYSLRLALMTTFVGIAFSVLLVLGSWTAAALLTAALLALAARGLLAGAREYAQPDKRSRVVAAVAAG